MPMARAIRKFKNAGFGAVVAAPLRSKSETGPGTLFTAWATRRFAGSPLIEGLDILCVRFPFGIGSTFSDPRRCEYPSRPQDFSVLLRAQRNPRPDPTPEAKGATGTTSRRNRQSARATAWSML